jgi:hypothetical protein
MAAPKKSAAGSLIKKAVKVTTGKKKSVLKADKYLDKSTRPSDDGIQVTAKINEKGKLIASGSVRSARMQGSNKKLSKGMATFKSKDFGSTRTKGDKLTSIQKNNWEATKKRDRNFRGLSLSEKKKSMPVKKRGK